MDDVFSTTLTFNSASLLTAFITSFDPCVSILGVYLNNNTYYFDSLYLTFDENDISINTIEIKQAKEFFSKPEIQKLVEENNWDKAEIKETYVWLESVMDGGGTYFDGDGGQFFWNTHKTNYTVMNYGACGYDIVGILEEENKTNDYRWCPFPKNEKNSKAINHVEVYGRGIGIPRKTNKENNRLAAVKFCELWCNRFTEARFDALISRSKWTYDQVKEFYDYAKTHGRMGMGSGVGKLASYAGAGATGTKFNASIMDAGVSTATAMAKLSNLAKQEIANVLKFGIQ